MVRRLRPGDGEALRELALRFKSAAPSTEAAAAFLADERNVVIAAGTDGFALGYELPRFDGDDTMVFLYEIGVVEERRRHGIGRALVHELRRQTPRARKMFVLTDDGWPAAPPFYAALGGRRVDPDQIMFEWRA